MSDIYICSPLNAETAALKEANRKKALEYMEYCKNVLKLKARAPHAYISLLVNDSIPAERKIAIDFGINLLALCTDIYVCGSKISPGMRNEIKKAAELHIPIWVFNHCLYPEVSKIIREVNPKAKVHYCHDSFLGQGATIMSA